MYWLQQRWLSKLLGCSQPRCKLGYHMTGRLEAWEKNATTGTTRMRRGADANIKRLKNTEASGPNLSKVYGFRSRSVGGVFIGACASKDAAHSLKLSPCRVSGTLLDGPVSTGSSDLVLSSLAVHSSHVVLLRATHRHSHAGGSSASCSKSTK